MTAIGALLVHLRRPEVTEVQLVSGCRPTALVNGELRVISDETLTADDVVRLLFTAGGSRYVDGLGPRPAQWRTRIEGVGAIGVTAVCKDSVTEARFILRDAASVAPGPVSAPTSDAAPITRSSIPPAVVDGEPRRRASQTSPPVGSSSRPPPSLEDWSTRPTHPRMERVPASPPITLAEVTPRSLARMVELELPPSFPSVPPPTSQGAGVAGALANTLPNLRIGGLAESGPLAALLTNAREMGASDIHLVPGRRAVLRVNGQLIAREPALDATTLATLLLGYAPRRAADLVQRGHAATFALEDLALGRFRVHVVPARGGVSASIRPIPSATSSLLALGIDAVVTPVLARGARFILVSSPRGNGRSTTIAAILERLSALRASTIVTVEDPIEHLLPARRALVRQVEVGTHARDRASAIASALADSPDVLSLGDLTEAATVRAGLRAALHGALVLASFPTVQPARAMEMVLAKLADLERRRARAILAGAQAVVLAQRLGPSRGDERGPLVASMEALELAPDSFELAQRPTPSSVPPGPPSVPPPRPPSLRPPGGGGATSVSGAASLLDRVFKKGG